MHPYFSLRNKIFLTKKFFDQKPKIYRPLRLNTPPSHFGSRCASRISGAFVQSGGTAFNFFTSVSGV